MRAAGGSSGDAHNVSNGVQLPGPLLEPTSFQIERVLRNIARDLDERGVPNEYGSRTVYCPHATDRDKGRLILFCGMRIVFCECCLDIISREWLPRSAVS